MNLARFDLNLLLVFDALIDEGSVTRVGARLFLSQPAISHALSRLRQLLDDPLFERTVEGMRPTPRALALAGPVRQVLLQIQSALDPETFDPLQATRRFDIAIHNYSTLLLLAPLAERIRRCAPNIDIRIHAGDSVNLERHLDMGTIDLAIGEFHNLPTRITTYTLFEDRYVCLMRAGHPALSQPFDLDAFASAAHLLISVTGLDQNWIDDSLLAHGRSRRIVMTAPHFLSAANILAVTDLVTCVPQRIERQFAANYGLSWCNVPLNSPPIACSLAWHHHLTGQRANAWLRNQLISIAQEITQLS